MASSFGQVPVSTGSKWGRVWTIAVIAFCLSRLLLGPDKTASIVSDVRSAIIPPTPTAAVATVPTATIPPNPTSTPSPELTATTAPTPVAASSWLRNYKHGLWLERVDPRLAAEIKKRGWIRNGIDAAESKAIQGILDVAFENRPVASSLVTRRWVRDGITDLEVNFIEKFAYLAGRDADAASRVLGMPFLKTIEPADVSAMESLARLAIFEPKTFRDVMSHPTLSDGITDQWAPIIATLHGVAETNPALIEVLLHPGVVVLESRTVMLPLSGEVGLYIIRTGPGATRSMDLLEHAVRGAEAYMGLPLPTNYVGLLFENAVSGSASGTNFGTHIVILPKYDVDDGSWEAELAGEGIVHEVAHYYWAGNADWIDEGAAEFVAVIIESARTGRAPEVTRSPCAYAGNIAELEFLEFEPIDAGFQCNYSLGSRLFADLHRAVGAERFRRGFRELYLTSLVEHQTGYRPGTSLGIGHVKEAFRSVDGMAEVVIARWYDGTEPYDLSYIDRGPIDPTLPGINGRIDEAYLTTGQDGPLLHMFPVQGLDDWIVLTLKFSYDVSGGLYEIPLEIVEYHQDGFVFHRRSGELTAESGYIGGWRQFWVGLPPSQRWAPGHYAVFVYADGHKVAEVYYEVTP